MAQQLVIAAGVGLLYYLFNNESKPNVHIIDEHDAAERAVAKLKEHCRQCRILGFDCEWNDGGRVALIPLCSKDGYCVLFRICKMGIPNGLEELLRNPLIIKVGVEPLCDANKLRRDYRIDVKNTLDLRFLAVMTGQKPAGLAKMSKQILDVTLDKDMEVVCSNWEAHTLSEQQAYYAANYARVGLAIYLKLARNVNNKSPLWDFLNVRFQIQQHRNLRRIDSNDCILQ